MTSMQHSQNHSWRIDMINLIADEVERLQKTSQCSLKFKEYLEVTYGTRDYGTLRQSQMKEFRRYLKSPTVEGLKAAKENNCIRLVSRK